MTNPANRIADLLEQWFNSADASLLEGGKLISEVECFIETSIAAGKDLAYMRSAIPKWAELLRRAALKQSNTEDISNVIFAIRALGMLMENDRPAQTNEEVGELENLATEFEEIVNSADDLPVQFRRYCFEVLFAVRRDIEEWKVSRTFDLQISIERLIAATNYVAAAYADKPTRMEQLRNFWERLLKLNKFGGEMLQLTNTASTLFGEVSEITS